MAQELSLERVRQYYGEVLKSSADLRTSACCDVGAVAPHIAAALGEVHEEVRARFYGCGSPIPPAIQGAHVLDLGCGAGRDCYILSKLVGPEGSVIGVDMTDAQLAVARKHREFHAKKFGHANVEFRHGYIEDLRTARIANDGVDLVVSNCVLNLSPDKRSVFHEIFRVLRPGGELFFSDVFADRRVPSELAIDPVLVGECLGGALYWEDFRRLMADVGVADVRVVERHPVLINDSGIEARIGVIAFESVTVRAFKLALEDRCEDYGQAAIYKGTIPELPHAFELDDHHRFERGRTMTVCGNTADMLERSRYAPHFTVIGDKARHFGLFDCGQNVGLDSASPSPSKCC
jgi:SAM-dependent methyltransferase